jgi:hypothetical protein
LSPDNLSRTGSWTQDNLANVEALKTCCGILAILSRDESNKVQIARNGVRLVVQMMEMHLNAADLLEAACDLLWSLAFNNTLVKDVIGRHGAIPVVIEGMKVHVATPDFLKSACGALSNLCQVPHNQTLIAASGGTRCLVEALSAHGDKAGLLPYVLDALASLIVGNEAVARDVAGSGVVAIVLEVMLQHGGRGDLVKSACHTLAILSDTKGQGASIARAGGVTALLPALSRHPANVDLHRVAAVVLLRMLQEAPVARDMARAGAVQLMLRVLGEQMGDPETVAAVSYILYAITHPDVLQGLPPLGLTTADVAALLQILRRYPARKDIVRACMRCLVNLSRGAPVMEALDEHKGLEPVLRSVVLNPTAKDVATCSVVLLKDMYNARAGAGAERPSRLPLDATLPLKLGAAPGLLLCARTKPNDTLLVLLVYNTIARGLMKVCQTSASPLACLIVCAHLMRGAHCPPQENAALSADPPDWTDTCFSQLINWLKSLTVRLKDVSTQ